LFLVLLLRRPPTSLSLWAGGTIALAGALLRLWAAGHIDKGRVVTQGGPYAFTRNPLYLGSFVMALGIIIAGQGYWLLPAFGIFFAVFYYPVIRAEEQELLQAHGSSFLEYSKRVPLFLPGFRRSGKDNSTFSWSRVIRNREHHTMVGLVVAVALLIVLKLIR
jgi:protein-S-isoprenylcysteine O-methyltransferase Ste14